MSWGMMFTQKAICFQKLSKQEHGQRHQPFVVTIGDNPVE